jgi:hypothetical protein
VEFSWNLERHAAFKLLKEKLIKLIPLDRTKTFYGYMDASNFCVGANLSQKDENGHDHPIYDASRQMSATEKNYTVTEKKALAIIFACKKFRHYLLGYKSIFHTDHTSLKYLVNKPNLSGRLACWVLLLQEFYFEVQVRSDKHHKNPDFLSRLPGKKNVANLLDEFLDEYILYLESSQSIYQNII